MSTFTPVQPPVPAQAPASRRPWNTLEILTRSRTGLVVLTLLLLAAILIGTQVHRDAMTLVGKDTVPSIISAQKIKTALADMDSDAADELLNRSGNRAAGLFEQHRIEASNSLIEAARNITFEAEKKPIETIEIDMGTYGQLIQQARDLQDSNQQEKALREYRAAILVMDGRLLPAADALDKANNDELEKQLSSRTSHSLIARLFVLGTGLAVLAALVMVQLYLSRRTQRTLNPALVAATFIALLLTVFAFGAMAREQSDLHAAKTDAFDSIHALLQARAVAYSANSDESRFLLDPVHGPEYQRAFEQKSALLAHTATPLDRYQLLAQLRSGEPLRGFTGFLADELNNITFAGEREAALDTVARYEDYLVIDRQIRTLETAGQHTQAVALDVGDQQGQSDWAFNQFDQALGRTLAINQTEFDRSVTSGFDAVAKLDWIAGITALVLVFLIFLGFAPRIGEYQG